MYFYCCLVVIVQSECVYITALSCVIRGSGGLVDAGPEYHKALAEEIAKLQRLYGGGDLGSFPEFNFPGG